MVQQTINIGTVANDNTGDPIRDAFDKTNDNFTELYAGAGAGNVTVVLVTTTSATAAPLQATMVDDDTAAGVVTITLPAGSANDQQIIKKLGTTANVIIDGDTAETIDGAATFTLTSQYASLTLLWNGTEWSIV